MITLYGFGPVADMADASAFVVKVEVLLKMAGLPYKKDNSGNLSKAPKGKIPYIEDEGKLIADSALIRFYLEQKYLADFDHGLSDEQKAITLLAEKYCEDSLYFVLIRDRWINEDNFNKGPRRFFDRAPALIRPIIIHMIRKKMRQTLWSQGFGRHSEAELHLLFEKGIAALAVILGDKPYFGGAQPCGADATLFGFLASFLGTTFSSVFGETVKSYPNLVAYRDRMKAMFYPELTQRDAAKAV